MRKRVISLLFAVLFVFSVMPLLPVAARNSDLPVAGTNMGSEGADSEEDIILYFVDETDSENVFVYPSLTALSDTVANPESDENLNPVFPYPGLRLNAAGVEYGGFRYYSYLLSSNQFSYISLNNGQVGNVASGNRTESLAARELARQNTAGQRYAVFYIRMVNGVRTAELGEDVWPDRLITVSPSCTEAGYTCYVGLFTGAIRDRKTLPATGHTGGEPQEIYNNPPSCTQAGSYDMVVCCVTCNQVIRRSTVALNPLGHEYINGVCTRCGAVKPSVTKPVITSQPKSVCVAIGSPATFRVAASGGDLCYQWQYRKGDSGSWINWSGKTAASVSFNGTSTNNGYQYRCRVSNGAGTAVSDAATLRVTAKLTITSQPKSTTVTLGNYASFNVAATGENLRYQWQYKKPGSDIWINWSGKTDSALSFKGASTNNGYQYRCVVSSDAEILESDAATLSVTSSVLPSITSQPKSATVALGSYASFSVTATGTNPSYQWQYKKRDSTTWTNWSGKTDATISFKGTSTNNAYQYRCVVSNDAGSVTSSAATLTVVVLPSITRQPKSVTVALGRPATFSVTATGENLRYQWQYKKPGSDTWYNWSGKTSASITFNGTSTNNGYQYRCVVSNDDGSVASAAATLTVTASG